MITSASNEKVVVAGGILRDDEGSDNNGKLSEINDTKDSISHYRHESWVRAERKERNHILRKARL